MKINRLVKFVPFVAVTDPRLKGGKCRGQKRKEERSLAAPPVIGRS